MVTILGAGGAIGNELFKELITLASLFAPMKFRRWFRVQQRQSQPIFLTWTTLSRRFLVLGLRFCLPV
jgi:hypothetical protein